MKAVTEIHHRRSAAMTGLDGLDAPDGWISAILTFSRRRRTKRHPIVLSPKSRCIDRSWGYRSWSDIFSWLTSIFLRTTPIVLSPESRSSPAGGYRSCSHIFSRGGIGPAAIFFLDRH